MADRQRERQIVEQGRLQGKSDEFIKQAITRFRQQSTQQEQPKKPGIFSRISNVFTEGKLLKAPSKFLFGTTGKTVGTLLGAGAESAKELATGEAGRTFRDQKITGTDIGFTVLETLPGGGALKNIFKKLPGGAKTVSKIDEVVKLLPEKLQADAIKLYTKAFKPTTIETRSQAKKAIPELLDRNVFGTSKSIQKKAEKKLAESGGQIGEIVERLSDEISVKTKPAIDDILKWQSKFVVNNVVVDKQAVKLGDVLMETFIELG